MTDECVALEYLQSAWLDGQLASVERVQMAAHLDACLVCQERLERLARTRSLLRSMPVREVPAALSGRIEMLAPAITRGPHTPSGGRIAAICAVLAGLVGGAAFGLGGQPHPATRLVQVPVDVYAVDHLVRTVGQPLSTPVVVSGFRS